MEVIVILLKQTLKNQARTTSKTCENLNMCW
jgi:hypothetical protein